MRVVQIAMYHSLLPLIRSLKPLYALSPLTKTVKLTGTHRLPGAFGNASTKEEFRVLVAQGVTAHLTAYGTDDSRNGRRQTNKKISRRGSTRASE